MTPELATKQTTIVDLCERFEVLKLGVLGSAAREASLADSSDVDFLVLFDRRAESDYLHRYLGLAESLEALLGRSVDLITEYVAQSPSFRAELDRDLISLYERSEKATAT
jgi:predicted nucleotidyltransferase